MDYQNKIKEKMATNAVKKSSVWLMISFCIISLLPVNANAWGRAGHHVVARIAARRLSTRAKEALTKLLQADPDDREMCGQQTTLEDKLACISTWADIVRREPQFADTAPLHFVNIPIFAPPAQRQYDAKRDCANDKCVVGGIEKYRAILADISKPAGERTLALKFLVHFIGDMHQPLHTAKDHDLDTNNPENHGQFTDNGDRGGNLKSVTWFGAASTQFGCWNLHAVWDDGILEHSQANELALTNALNGALTPQKISNLQRGAVVDWINEAFRLALTKAYRLPPRQKDDKVCEVLREDTRVCEKFSPQVCGNNEVHYRYHLGNNYFSQNLPTVKAQLTSAGVRLARFLNDIFDQ